MSEQDIAEAEVVEDVAVEEVAPVDDAPEGARDEEVARERGWKPREEWKGDVPASFMDDPREFNDFFERSNPRLKSEVEELRSRLEAFDGWKQKQEKLYERRLEQELSELGAALQDATDKGDHKAVQSIVDRRDQIRDEIIPRQQPASEDSFQQWVSANPWYDTGSPKYDPGRAKFAERVGEKVRQENPDLTGIPFLNAVKRAVEDEYTPSKPKESVPAKVEGVRRAGASSKKKVSEWSQLPSRVQQDKNVERIVNKMYGGDKDRYARDWAEMNQET